MTSSVPLRPGPPNPHYSKMVYLVDRSAQLRALQQSIRELASQNPGMPVAELKKLASEQKQQFMSVLQGFQQEPTVPQCIGPPPSSVELYGRFADGVQVLDVGSGDLKRIRADTGRLVMSVCEPKPPTLKGKVDPALSHLNLQERYWKRFSPDMVKDRVVSSFNAVVQFEEPEELIDFDGLHVLPDHAYLKTHASVKEVVHENKLKYAVSSGANVFLDTPVDWPGYEVKEGYKLSATYSAKTIQVNFGENDLTNTDLWLPGDVFPTLDATPASPDNVNWKDIGYKWDGQCYEIELSNGICYATTRSGKFITGTTNFPYHCCFWVERLVQPLTFVLLRVITYRGFIPPHCGDSLRQFALRNIITIDGCTIYGPPPYSRDPPTINGKHFPTDGVITRVEERDFYIKKKWTVDLLAADIQHFKTKFMAKGLIFTVDKIGHDLTEYQIDRAGGTIAFTYLRTRKDKTKRTANDTVEYLLTLPTLEDLRVIYKHDTDLVGTGLIPLMDY